MSKIDLSRPLSRDFCERFLLPAVCSDQLFVVSEILRRSDININICSNYGQTPLSLAAERGHKDIVTLLCSHSSIDVNAQDTDGQTALGWAVFNGHIDTVSTLLQNPDVRTDVADMNGLTPVSWAITKKRVTILLLLLEKVGLHPNKEFLKQLSRGSVELEQASPSLDALERRGAPGHPQPLLSHPVCDGERSLCSSKTNPFVCCTSCKDLTCLQQMDIELAPLLCPLRVG